MGVHKGYRIIKQRLKRGVSFTAQIREGGRYSRSKTFSSAKYPTAKDALAAANLWGKDQAERVLHGVKSLNSGRVMTVDTLKVYFKMKREADLDEYNLAQVEGRLDSLPNFCPDLANEDAPRQIYNWWQDWCQQGNKGNDTKNTGLKNVRSFLTWAHKAKSITGLRTPVDIDFIQKLRTDKKVKPQFTIDELRRGFTATITTRERITKPHPYVIRWALYIYLGARLHEALRLRYEHFEGRHVLLYGKGRKERLVPMQDELQPFIDRHKQEHDYDGFLFPHHLHNCDKSNAAKHLNTFLKKAGIEKRGRTTHSLRHCYTGLMTATGEPTALLQAYLGHSQSDMTRHYSEMAARYRADVEGWKRGEIRLK